MGLRRDAGIGLIILWSLAFTYAPLYLSDYAVCDDHVLMFSDAPFEHAYLSDGRPLFALAHYLVHRPIDHLNQLAYLRFVSVVWIIGLSLLFYRLTKHIGGSRFERAAFAICLGTLPCLHDYVAQANFWLAPLAGLCSCLAAILAFQAITRQTKEPGRQIPKWLSAMLLMLIAALIYQPMLSFYWTVALVFLLDGRFIRSDKYRRSIIKLIVAGLIYFCICFIAFKIALLCSPVGAKERTALMNNPLEKLYWFLRIQLPLALNYWHLMISGTRLVPLLVATCTGVVIAIGFLASFRASAAAKLPATTRIHLLRLGLVVAVVMLSHVHWLAIADVPQGYRIIASLGVAAWVLMFWAFRQCTAFLPSAKSRLRTRQVGMIAIAVAAMMVCRYYSDAYWVTPYSLAHRYMLSNLRERLTEDVAHIHVIRQGRDDGLVESYFIESFARPLSEPPWIIEDWVKFSLRDTQIQHRVEKITHSDPEEPISVGPATLVIDMRKLKNFRIP
jgi:hypothetical protein